jgi:hypothetical protein
MSSLLTWHVDTAIDDMSAEDMRTRLHRIDAEVHHLSRSLDELRYPVELSELQADRDTRARLAGEAIGALLHLLGYRSTFTAPAAPVPVNPRD